MRDDEYKIECDYYCVGRIERPSVGGCTAVRKQPRCLREGSHNNPPTFDRPFAQNCAACEHNKYTAI